ncbi:DUF1302 family protein [Treponema pectinovorum]|uniref:DUF1302 family protein n=1 Tax=Treponema pectinovorum TaxID=164 RepID=UPI0011C7299B|nr:DUF1302 family protein [Treponema pectinovorum]
MKKLIYFLAVSIFSTGLFAQETSFSGNLSNQWGALSPWTSDSWDFSLGKIDFTGKIESTFQESRAFIEGNINHDFITSQTDFELNEAYIDYSKENWGFKIGRQKIVWGKADGLDITNYVFPQDLSSIFEDENTIAVNGLKFSVYGSTFNIETLWLPFFRGTKLPLENSNPLKKYVIPPQAISIALNSPELNLKNGEYGIKASGYFSLCDISIYGFYGWDKFPNLTYKTDGATPPTITINGKYERLAMLGLDMAIPIKEIVLRAETAYFPNRKMQSASVLIMGGKNSFIEKNEIMGLIGVDWMKDNWTLTAQYYCDNVFSGVEGLERKSSYEHASTLSISKTLLSETLKLSLSAVLGLNDFDSAASFKAEYELSDQIKIGAGIKAFFKGAKNDGKYGVYKDLSTQYIKVQYVF